jgi:hypothetical protein
MAMTRAKASQVTAKLDAAGSTVRGLDDKLAEFVSVKDFGAVGDGVTTLANDTAFASAEASATEDFYLPAGIYALSSMAPLTKRYWGPGQIRFSDGYVQAGEIFSDLLPRGFEGNRVITSPTDLVLSPNGNVQFAGKRILNVGDPVGLQDAVTKSYLEATAASYSKGTFTPVIEGTTTAGTATYSAQYGSWVKIGDLVTVRVRLDWSDHTGTGSYSIPWTMFVPKANLPSPPGVLILSGNWTSSGAGTLFSYITNGRIYPARDYQDGTADSLLTIQSSGTLDAQITYEV